MGKRCQVVKKMSTRHSNSTAAIPDEETYESTPNIFPTSFFWETHQFFLPFLGRNSPIFLPHFLGKSNFPTSFFWEIHQFSYLIFLRTHQFFLPHFLGKPTNLSYLIFLGNPQFSYLIFLGNPPIFPTSFFGKPTNLCHLLFWETRQFFLPHFLGKPTNFSYFFFWGNPPIFPTSFFWGNPPIFPTSFSWETYNLVNETLIETPPHEVFGYYLCYYLEFLQAFHNEGRYHWYLQYNTSLVILSDEGTEKFKFEYWGKECL